MDSGIGDFFRQVPSGVIFMFCGSGILLVITVAAIAGSRMRRASSPAFMPTMNAFAVSGGSGSDLPDLDMLLGGTVSSTPAPQPPAARPPARRSGTYNLVLADGSTVEAADVMTISRDLADGSLIIQIGDGAYSSETQITDPEARRRFVNTMRELARMAADAVNANPADISLKAPAPNEASATFAPEPPARPAAPPSPPPNRSGEMPGDLPKFKSTDMPFVTPGRGKKPVMEPVPEINIADAIEAYLQHKLRYTPTYDGRSIHVLPAVGGGVKIEVDGRYFDSVSEVDDQDVRNFLGSTIEEWQSRQ